MADHPLHECVSTAAPLILSGATIHQKYTCSACGSRQTIAEANRFFTRGKCEECSHITNIEAQGCNYLVIFGDSIPAKGSPQ
jgi:DNA-directed RNA polymerase subunit RPC12/RpoP